MMTDQIEHTEHRRTAGERQAAEARREPVAWAGRPADPVAAPPAPGPRA